MLYPRYNVEYFTWAHTNVIKICVKWCLLVELHKRVNFGDECLFDSFSVFVKLVGTKGFLFIPRYLAVVDRVSCEKGSDAWPRFSHRQSIVWELVDRSVSFAVKAGRRMMVFPPFRSRFSTGILYVQMDRFKNHYMNEINKMHIVHIL